MPEIHLLNRESSPLQPRDLGDGVTESGFWRISLNRAQAVVGHPIHFHRRKAAPSHLSGIVTDFRRQAYTTPKGETSPRTVFVFKPDRDLEGTITSTAGWTPAGVKFLP